MDDKAGDVALHRPKRIGPLVPVILDGDVPSAMELLGLGSLFC